jgi:arylsulfatase A-like enzyme
MLQRREFLTLLAAPMMAQQSRPNVIFIMADDLGYGDLGCYGQKQIQTPVLDKMAAEGMRFTQAYAGCTVCAPSRCALMTGLHTGHARIRGNNRNEELLRAEDFTIPEMFRNAGYATGMFGKWGLGGLGFPGYPTKKGWGTWFGYFSQRHAHTYYPEHLLDQDSEYLCVGNFGARKRDYAPDLFLKRGLEFLEKNRSRPFLMYFSNPIPHANNELGADTGDGIEVPEDAPYSGRPWPALERKFAATVTRLDRDIGRIFEKLKELGLDRNTLVLFSSDNGPHREGGHDPNYFSSSGIVRGIKRDLTEGGIRVPFLAWWPGRVPAGKVNEHPIAFWDMMPTLASVIGATAPKGIDGLNMWPAMLGQKAPEHEYLYWEFHEGGFSQALRAGDWKLIKTKGQTLLFNVREDVHEDKNLAAEKPEIVARLEKLLAGARTDSPDFPVNAARPAARKKA